MNDHLTARVREIFDALLEVDSAEREQRLHELSEGNLQIEQRVRKLLDAHERATHFESVIIPQGEFPMGDPETIGPFRVLEKLAEGGMGVVYLAEQKKPVRRRVAIKIIRPGMASSEVINRFNAERQALALMTHPGIARILDAGATEQGLPYFVMEYVSGTPVIKYCNAHRLSLRERIMLFRQVCVAVQHAHQKGIIHRDLKPSNILVTEENGQPIPKVIDFGIAKALSQPLTEHTLHTRSGLLIGTPDYMSPEQCGPENIDIDTRSDVYSLGAMLYQLLSGCLPHGFHREKLSDLEIVHRLRELDPPPPSRRALDADAEDVAARGLSDAHSLQRQLRGELDWIVMKALERDRNRRYGSAQALADDLQRYLENIPVLAGPPSIRYRTGKFIRRHLIGVAVVAGAFITISAFAGLMAWQVEQTRMERDRANRQADIAGRVTDFMSSMFKAASPTLTGKADVSVREVLDIGVQELDARIGNSDPETRAALLEAAAIAYRDLGDYDQADTLFNRVLDIRNEYKDTDPIALGSTLLEYAVMLSLAGEMDSALPHAQAAERIFRSSIKGNEGKLRKATALHAHLLRELGELEQAWLHIQPALIEPETADGDDPHAYSFALNHAALIESSRGNFDSMKELLQALLDHEASLDTPDGQQVREAKSLLARVHREQGNPDLAEPLQRSVLVEARNIYGDNHPEIAALTNNLAVSLMLVPDKHDEAFRLFQESIDIKQRIFGSIHQTTGQGYLNTASLHAQRDEWQAAYDNYLVARNTYAQALGDRHSSTVNASLGMARSLVKLGRPAEAEPLLREGLADFLGHYGPRHWRTGIMRSVLGMSLSAQRKYQEAEIELRESLAILTDTLGATHWQTERVRAAVLAYENVTQQDDRQ